MDRNTIDFGIDLGTTNSEIAVLNGTHPEIIKNNEGMDYTPSAVYYDSRGNLTWGRKAKYLSIGKAADSCIEFKRGMGTEKIYQFKSSGISKSPEELSAIILASLKNDALTKRGENLASAVITVPADFELPRCNATLRAAKLAGLENCPLLQEPIAAALAYGFQSKSNNVFWLVYDFGGGTFDAALIHLRDGLFKVINHQGDNYLGGSNLDWSIVDNIVVPEILKNFNFKNFIRDDEKWKRTFDFIKIGSRRIKN